MNRLTLIAATGILTLTLTACGDQSKPADTSVTVQPTETVAPAAAPAEQPAAPAEQPAAEQQPASDAPAQ